jgi:hypothetical protein
MRPAPAIRAPEQAPCDLYAAYESARHEAAHALAGWRDAAHESKGERFSVYRAAADREDAAAVAWMQACSVFDSERAEAA